MYDVGGIMTLRHMKIFVAVFENSSITKAAKELHLAQPSVSFSIKELEDYLGNDFLSGSADESIRPQQPETFMVMQSILYLYLRQWKRN